MLSEFVREAEKIAQEHKIEISIAITPHGTFIDVTLCNGNTMSFGYESEMEAITEELGHDPNNSDFINYLITQTMHFN